PGPAGLRRRAGGPVRLLPERDDHEHRGAPFAPAPAHRGAGARRAIAQPVPLRHAPRDPRGGAAGGRADGHGGPVMTRRAASALTRADFRNASGVLLVLRDPPPPPPPAPGQPPAIPGNPAEGPEILLAVWDDGSVTALNGHVDLGTGSRTALAQIVRSEERRLGSADGSPPL